MNYKLKEITEAEFNDFANKNTEANFLQSVQQYKLLQMRNVETYRLGVVDDQENVLLAANLQVLKTRFFGNIGLVTRGPLYLDSAPKYIKYFAESIKDWAKKHNIFYVQILPNHVAKIMDKDGNVVETKNNDLINLYESFGFKHQATKVGFNSSFAPIYQYVKDLTALTNETLLNSYKTNAKRIIKKAPQMAVHVRNLEYEELAKFKELTAYTANKQGFPDKPLSYYQEMYEAYGDKVDFIAAEINFPELLANLNSQLKTFDEQIEKLKAKLAERENEKSERKLADLEKQKAKAQKQLEEFTTLANKYDEDKVMASAAMFLTGPTEIVYLHSGAYDEFAEFSTPYSLQNHMMEKAVQAQLPLFNFYGLNGTFDGSDGVLEFKDKFAGHVEEMIGEFNLVINPIKYKLYTTLKK